MDGIARMDTPPPDWPHCGRGANPGIDQVGCRGIQVPGYSTCLAHLTAENRAAYLSGLQPGDEADYRGTTFDGALLRDLLAAQRESGTARPVLGNTRFDETVFLSGLGCNFDNVTFDGSTRFDSARFSGNIWFRGVKFLKDSWFSEAIFNGHAYFSEVEFHGDAWFNGSVFEWESHYGRSTFLRNCRFYGAYFTGRAVFNGVNFCKNSWFAGARFDSGASFSNARFAGESTFEGAVFDGDTKFTESTFGEEACFTKAEFTNEADFCGVSFENIAAFGIGMPGTQASFLGDSLFKGATFTGDASFEEVTFSGVAAFTSATFEMGARFEGAVFQTDAHFSHATFSEWSHFLCATFSGKANFERAKFRNSPHLGPLVCQGALNLQRATFTAPVTIEATAAHVNCFRTHWESTATLHLRKAGLNLRHAVLVSPVAVIAHPTVWRHPDFPDFDESAFSWSGSTVTVTSLRGVDCAMLTLTDIDLTPCRFAGAFHLDQLRLEGSWTLGAPPDTRFWRREISLRWTQRQVIAEEREWRALSQHPSSIRFGWGEPPHDQDTVGPSALAVIYRQLRKAREDAKDEPGAADFYYGEMEMRRHSFTWRQAERWLLQGYWGISGYGLRASRALGWLLLAMTATMILMMGFGLPDEAPKQEVRKITVNGTSRMVIDKRDPRLTLPLGQRFTVERFEKSLRTVLNSVVFRSSGQDLTIWGTYTEMACRFGEPVLLGLAALAIRGRVKRGN